MTGDCFRICLAKGLTLTVPAWKTSWHLAVFLAEHLLSQPVLLWLQKT